MKKVSLNYIGLLTGAMFVVLFVSGRAVNAQNTCSIRFINQDDVSKMIDCLIKITDEEEKEIYKKRSRNGHFEIKEIENELLDYCNISFQESNNRYWPVDPGDLKCPVRCGKRILVKRKPRFEDI